MDGKNLVEKAKAGKDLTKEERQEAIKQLLRDSESYSNGELADLFDVSERTIYKDRRAVRKEVSDQLLTDYGLPGALWIEYRQARKEMDKVKQRAENAGDIDLLRKATKDKWKITKEFYDRILEGQIINRIERLEEKINEGR